MKKLIQNIVLSLGIITGAGLMSVPATVNAGLFDGAKDQACQGASLGSGTACDADAANKGINSLIKTVLNILSLAVGIIAVIMVIVAGLKYITSQGDSNSVNSAKNTLLYAVVGLVIVALAQVIVRFVLSRV